MIGIKQEFYSSLRDDYIKKGTDSFLYRYMEQEKKKLLLSGEKNVGSGKRSDAYLQIKMYEQDLQVGKISQTEYLMSLLQMLLKGDKLRLKKETRQRILGFALEIEGNSFFDESKRDLDKYKNVIVSLSKVNEIKTRWEKHLNKECLGQITNELLESALTVDIQTFLYDVGYPVNANRKINTARKKDRNLDMLTAYCQENNIVLQQQHAGERQLLTEEQLREYQKLFELLQTSDNMDVIIPVQVDAVTGAGVYIVGKNNISPKSAVFKNIKGNCCYACFLVDGLGVEDYKGISSFSWLINDEENSLCNLPDLEEALKWFLYLRAENMGDFQERNGKAPKDCPKDFLCYFERETKDELYVSAEELEEVKVMFE